MTSVAMGAAIYAESRDWTGGNSTAKSSRATAKTTGPFNIEYGFPTRTSDGRIRIRVRPSDDLVERGYRLQIDNDMGWTSGQLPLDTTNAINDVPVVRRGDNQFRVTIFDAAGYPIKQAETRFTVKRTDATAGGTPLTHTIAVKIVEVDAGAEKNLLHVLIEKGHALPATGVAPYRAAHDLRSGDGKFLEFEVYQMDDPDVTDPTLNLHVGAFRINSEDLDRGEVIRRGTPIKVCWSLDENGLLNCELEIDSIGRRFATGKMFVDQGALKSFDGKEGEQLANSMLDMAERELDELEKTLGSRVTPDSSNLKSQIESQRESLKSAYEPDARRSIADEGRTIRREISKIKNKRENVGDVLRAELDGCVSAYDAAIRPGAIAAVSDRVDRLARQARDSISQGNIGDARKTISEIRATFIDEARKQPAFVVDVFLDIARERHFAIDKSLHDQLVEAGTKCIDRQDIDGVRVTIGKMLENRYPTTASDSAATTLAGLMRA
jgi:molecular chaperone DnaK